MVSAIVLIIFSPFLLFIQICIFTSLGIPTIFIQKRPGLNNYLFNFYKFRTMTNDLDYQGKLLPDKDRVTSLGSLLRRTSMDELPNFWNVLRGDMSLVGPRPLLVGYLPLYSDYQSRRHEVKPGITGWSQINGRNNIPWEKKFDLDIWYVDNKTFFLDVRILFITVFRVFNKVGINQTESITMEKFRGSN
jgi:sugar transferase EpsL